MLRLTLRQTHQKERKLCNLCDDHVHYWWDKWGIALCNGKTALIELIYTKKGVNTNSTKIQMKATLGIGDHLYQCQPTSSIITFNFFHSHFRFNKPSAAYSAHWSCVCTNCGKNLSFYRIHVFIIRIYQFQQLTRCFSGHLSIRHPSILFGQVLNNIKW